MHACAAGDGPILKKKQIEKLSHIIGTTPTLEMLTVSIPDYGSWPRLMKKLFKTESRVLFIHLIIYLFIYLFLFSLTVA